MATINKITSGSRITCVNFTLILALVLPLTIYAQSTQQTVAINIAAQPLDQAITQLAAQTGVLIGVDASLIADKQAPAVSGHYTAEQAIMLLLAGSGLIAVENAPGRYTLESASLNSQSKSDSSNQLLFPEVKVSSTMEDDSPHNKSYSRRNASTASRIDLPIMKTPFSVQVVTQ